MIKLEDRVIVTDFDAPGVVVEILDADSQDPRALLGHRYVIKADDPFLGELSADENGIKPVKA